MHHLRKRRFPAGAVLLIALFVSCKSIFVPVKAEFEGYPITPASPRDTAMQVLMAPYRDSVDRSMNQVIGEVEKSLEKKQPEGTLGNFMADAMYYSGKQKYGIDVDAAFVNYGGIRIPQLAAGPVTRGKIFELMPFDNIVVVQRMKGNVLQEFLNLIAEKGGWPVAGIKMEIKDKKAINIHVGGQPLDLNKTYTIVNSDYVANGGDNAAMLKTVPQETNGYLMRDAIFDYINMLQVQGKKINAHLENRIVYAQ